MPQKWGIWLKVEGDLKFLSHRQTLRTVQRVAVRAGLPLRYTQGFNPHPVCSLACPRPVGVSSNDELLVLSLEAQAEPGQAEWLIDSLNSQAPSGMEFHQAKPLEAKTAPQPTEITYEMPLVDATQAQAVKTRLVQLQDMPSWL
ncbi:unnamed protein product, partial [marine sediment metagenome]